jgi:hypothetical protein
MSLTRSEQARLNGPRSQGPVCIDGKRRSAQNSAKRGLVADKVVVLQNEMPEAFDRVYNAFAEKFNPQDDAERELVLQAAVARWRLRRVWQIETSLIDLKMDEQRDLISKTFESCDEVTRQAVAFRSLADDTRALTFLNRYETRISREYDRAIRALDRLREDRASDPESNTDPEPPPTKYKEIPNEPKPAVPEPRPRPVTPESNVLPFPAGARQQPVYAPLHLLYAA